VTDLERQLRQHLAHEAAQVNHFPRLLASRIEAAVESGRRPAPLQQMALAAGLVILAIVVAIGVSQALGFRSQPASLAGPWEENLTFSGAVTGTVHSTVAGDAEGMSTCIGKYAKAVGGWSADLVVEVAGKPYHFAMSVVYRGPGTYSNSNGSRTVFVHLGDETDRQTFADDAATITLDAGNESGTVEAMLTKLGEPASNFVRVSGRWTCRTRT